MNVKWEREGLEWLNRRRKSLVMMMMMIECQSKMKSLCCCLMEKHLRIQHCFFEYLASSHGRRMCFRDARFLIILCERIQLFGVWFGDFDEEINDTRRKQSKNSHWTDFVVTFRYLNSLVSWTWLQASLANLHHFMSFSFLPSLVKISSQKKKFT